MSLAVVTELQCIYRDSTKGGKNYSEVEAVNQVRISLDRWESRSPGISQVSNDDLLKVYRSFAS